MKKSFFLLLQIIVLITVIFGCSDKVVQEPTYAPPSNPVSSPVTPPPIATSSTDSILRVYAGIDQLIFLPLGTNFTANAYDFIKYKTDLKYEWKKIKGPDKYKMDDSTKINPILSNLDPGTYEFAFIVTTPDARFASDTVKIQVAQTIGELVIPNLAWQCPWGCGLQQILIRIPNDKPIRVYIKPEGSVSNWVEAKDDFPTGPLNSLIYYGIENEYLWIYSDIQSGKCDLKIVFL